MGKLTFNNDMYNNSSDNKNNSGDAGKPVEVTRSIGACHYCGKPVHVTVRAIVKLHARVFEPDASKADAMVEAPINSTELSVEPRIVERGIRYNHNCMPTVPTMVRGTSTPRKVRMPDETWDSDIDGDTDL